MCDVLCVMCAGPDAAGDSIVLDDGDATAAAAVAVVK